MPQSPAAAAVERLEPAKQVQLELASKFNFKLTGMLIPITSLASKFNFKLTGMLIPITSHPNQLQLAVTNLEVEVLKLKTCKAEGVNLKPYCSMCMRSQARGSGTYQSYDVGLTASLTWRCRDHVIQALPHSF